MAKENYPEKYQSFKLKWIENKPFKKKGDKVIILRHDKYEIITLETMTKEPMQLRWINLRCRSCRRPGTVIETGKYVYRWNDGAFTEGVEINAVDELNKLKRMADLRYKEAQEYSEKATLFDQIKRSLEGEIIDNDY